MNMLARIVVTALCLGLAQWALAQDYPSRPVKIVVAYTPGAENDIIARLAAQSLSQQLKQPFVVENRPGASGVIGADFVAKSAPDGYTLLLGNTTLLAILTNLDAKLPYQPQRDFEAVSIIATIPTVLVVNASLPVNSLAELMAYAKAKPGSLNYASPGTGTPMHLIAELFSAQAGVKMAHVPYKGAAPAIADLIAGQVQMMFPNVPSVVQHLKSGKLKALATPNATRLAVLPDVPTLAEAGIRDIEQSSWFAIVAPKGTPKAIVNLLGAEIASAVNKPEMRQKLQDLGAEPRVSVPDETAAHMAREIAIWGKAVKASGIRPGD
jgi:tripartite-type tricarboxylate transporter receptor subunit TctC